MSWVTVIFSMIASACLTMALIYGFIWRQKPGAYLNLLFALTALGTAASAGCELMEMHADSPAQIAMALRWEHVSVWVTLLALAGFVRIYLRAGRIWLLWTVCGLRTVSLFLNFLTGQNLNYRDVTGLGHLSFLGEPVSIAQGVPNPWMLVGQLSMLWLVIFVVDAAIAVWRRGDRRRALMVGGGVVFFLLAGAGQSALIFWGYIHWPLTAGLFCLGIIVVMSYELGGEASRAAKLSDDLSALSQQLNLAAEAASLGFWFRDFARNEITATDEWRALFGFTKTERLHLDDAVRRLHPDDREMTRRVLEKASQGDGRYQIEYRVILPDGRMRWIASQGRVEFDADRQPVCVKGVSLDITRIKRADLEAQAQRIKIAHLQRVASLAELSSSLANELKQPLTAILSNAQAAQLLLARGTYEVEEIKDILSDIVASESDANKTIDRMSALLKKGEYKPQLLDANELVQEALLMMNHDLNARAVTVVTELAAGLPSIRGDRLHLQQVLINLILNAADAMSQPADNSRTLTLRSRQVDGNGVRISVADTGGGIAPGSEEKIFEPYHTTKPQGVGLGLSLSRSIVFDHGGRLWAENQIWGGATFHFMLPEWKGEPG
jgi:two-component system, LuxR family, sensor kinase FixL